MSGTAPRARWIVAIDGPAGAGKSTVARELAKALGFVYLDSGAMYRCVALLAIRGGVDPTDASPVTELAQRARIEFVADGDEAQRVRLDGEDVSDAIRMPEISAAASQVSVHPDVRAAMVSRQQALGAGGGIVMEGRDIGTVVFPNAQLKIYLTASDEERAARRLEDLRARGNHDTTLEEVLGQQRERDRRDATRAHSPLRAAADAVTVTSDGRSIADIVESLAARVPEAAR